MSQKRAIWNDGQGLATPDLQRSCDGVGSADDRVLEIYHTPGSVQKKVFPLTEEAASSGTNGFTGNPAQLAVPSTAGLTPAGTNGAVRVLPAQLIAGAPSGADAAQRVSMAGTLYSPVDSAAITSNSSGSIRYDLIYATVQRSVSTTGTRKIKSAVDGTLSSQTINLEDAPSVTLGTNVGFLTGATAPTLAQIAAAVPGDTAPSSSTFGAFNFPIAYVTVANGYSSGTALSQNSAAGSTYITQAWNGGWVQPRRVHGSKAMSFYTGSISEKPAGALLSERWGSATRFFGHFKLLTSSTAASVGPGSILDASIDWRHRLVVVTLAYLGSATLLPETVTTPIQLPIFASGTSPSMVMKGMFTGTGPAAVPTDMFQFAYNGGSNGVALNFNTDGTLRVCKLSSGPVDAANGDLLMVDIIAYDQFVGGL